MIVGIGIDTCDVQRFAAATARSSAFLDRVLTPLEQEGTVLNRAGRFAAKEAFAKALGAPVGLVWTDVEVRKDDEGRPVFVSTGTVAARVAALGVSGVHLSITHDAGVATAMVICEG